MGDEKLEESEKALRDKMAEIRYDARKKVLDQEKAERDLLNAKLTQEQEAREAAAEQPERQKQQARARAEMKESIRLNKELRESGVKGFDRFDTSLNQVILSMLQDAKALREKYQPYTNIFRALKWLGKQGAALVGYIGEAAGSKLEDVLGFNRYPGDKDLPEGHINVFDMMEFGEEGQLTFTQSFADLPGIREELGVVDGMDGAEKLSKVKEADEFFKQSVYALLKKHGYERRIDDVHGEVWERGNPDDPAALKEPLNAEGLRACFQSDIEPETLNELLDEAMGEVEKRPPVYEPDDLDEEDEPELDEEDEHDHRFDLR